MSLKKTVLGNAIRTSRIENNLSQEMLAEMVGITPTHLKHIESEHRKPSIDVLIEIAQTLHMSLDNIIFPLNSIESKKINDVINELTDCTSDELQVILDVIHSLKKNLRQSKRNTPSC